MWKPRQIGSKTLSFEMIEEKKIFKIEDMSGNEVYLGWESVSEDWPLESVLRYRLSYSSEIQFIKEMRMLYAEQHWTKAIDLKSAVKRLYEKLGALEFDTDHEAIYGMERYYTVQQCEELRDKYKIGRKENHFSIPNIKLCETQLLTFKDNQTCQPFTFNLNSTRLLELIDPHGS
ncbi:hypothetical protein FQA39_LY09173 [Lamprigera yunnana]|nr:hypothetical protein FQA39_LY09173 [Lamprigera yunnana]